MCVTESSGISGQRRWVGTWLILKCLLNIQGKGELENTWKYGLEFKGEVNENISL